MIFILNYSTVWENLVKNKFAFCYVVFNNRVLQIGDLRAVSGILYIMLEKLRVKLGVLDSSNGKYTGALLETFLKIWTRVCQCSKGFCDDVLE